jgi:dynein heavy chain
MSLGTLKIFLNDVRDEINWEAIWYMIGQINYGGRVTDNWDRICLLTILKKCITPDLLITDKYFYS